MAMASPTTPCSRGSPTTPSPPSPRTPRGRSGWAPMAVASIAWQQEGRYDAFPWSSQGLPGTIYGMLEDAAGRLWLSSKTGIFRVSIAELNAYASGAAQCHRGRGLRHGGRHEHPRMQRGRPPGSLEAGGRKPVVCHPRRSQFHRSRACTGKPRAPAGGDRKGIGR